MDSDLIRNCVPIVVVIRKTQWFTVGAYLQLLLSTEAIQPFAGRQAGLGGLGRVSGRCRRLGGRCRLCALRHSQPDKVIVHFSTRRESIVLGRTVSVRVEPCVEFA